MTEPKAGLTDAERADLLVRKIRAVVEDDRNSNEYVGVVLRAWWPLLSGGHDDEISQGDAP